jgi:hypothetical protein
VRVDLFGFCDVLAVKEGATLAVQCTSADHVSHRLAKLRECPGVQAALSAGWTVELWGWRKGGPQGARKLWIVSRRPVTVEDLVAVNGSTDDAANVATLPAGGSYP